MAYAWLSRLEGLRAGYVLAKRPKIGPVALADVLSIPVNPGDQFYLVASSAATAGGLNAFAESLSTLTISFDPADAARLQAANAPAAVPAMSWPFATLLVVTLACLGGSIVFRRNASIPA